MYQNTGKYIKCSNTDNMIIFSPFKKQVSMYGYELCALFHCDLAVVRQMHFCKK